LRDAESALDQVSAFCGRKISESDVLQVFGLVSRRQLEELCSAVLAGSIADILRVIADLDAAGKDLSRLAAEVLDYFRNLLVMVYAPSVLDGQEVPEHQIKLYKEQAAALDAGRLTRMVDQIIHAQGQLKFALSRRVVLEMALIRAARAATVLTIDEAIAELKHAAGDESAAQPASPEPASIRAPAGAPQKKTTEPVSETASEAAAPSSAPGDELALLVNHWPNICDQVGAIAPLSRSYVKDTKPFAINELTCTIGCDPEFAGHLAHIRHPKCISAFQRAIENVLGRKVTVHVEEFKQAQAGKLPSDHPVPAAGDTSAGDAVPLDRDQARKRKWEQDPAVRRTLEIFNGNITDIRE